MGKHDIAFSGATGRVADMTWGQMENWLTKVVQGDESYWDNILANFLLPSRTRLADVTSVLTELVYRHEALRTRYFVDGAGNLKQEAVSAGTVSFDLVDDPSEEQILEIEESLRKVRFDLGDPTPIRFVLIRERNTAPRLITLMDHISFDGYGVLLLRREILDTLAGGCHGQVRPTQPVDRAEYEASAKGQARNDRSLRFFRSQYEDLPAFGINTEPYSPRFVSGQMSVPDLNAAIARVAREIQCSRTEVILAAVSRAMAAETGSPVIPLLVMFNNRTSPALREMVGCIAQWSVVRVTASKSMEATIRSTKIAALRGYVNARYDPRAVCDLRGPWGPTGGDGRTGPLVYVNDVSVADLPMTGRDVPPLWDNPIGWSNVERNNDRAKMFYLGFGDDKIDLFIDSKMCGKQTAERLISAVCNDIATASM